MNIDRSGQAFEVKEANILFETDTAAMLAETSRRLDEIKEDLERDPLKEEPEEEPEEAPAPRRRGRPKKATVESLMAKVEQVKIRKEGGNLWDS